MSALLQGFWVPDDRRYADLAFHQLYRSIPLVSTGATQFFPSLLFSRGKQDTSSVIHP